MVVHDAARATPRASRRRARDVAVLEGGLQAFARVGDLSRNVNMPSKAFGDRVEAIRHAQSLPASGVRRLLDEDRDVVAVDARRFEVFLTMSIPGGRSLPGGEWVSRIREAVPCPDTRAVVDCAGRPPNRSTSPSGPARAPPTDNPAEDLGGQRRGPAEESGGLPRRR